MLTRKTRPVLAVGLAVLAVMSQVPFGLIARAAAPQASTGPTNPADRFAGTWHWMFEGKSFATMVLKSRPSGMTGSLTGAEMELNEDGSLKSAASSGEPPSEIEKAWVDGSELHFVVMDGDDPMEWLVILKDDHHAQVRPLSGDMANMQPIAAEKAH